MSNMRVEEQTGKKVRPYNVQIQKEDVYKTTEGGRRPRSDIRRPPGSNSGVGHGGPQTRVAKTLVKCVGPKYEEFGGKWHFGCHRSSDGGERFNVLSIGEETLFIFPRKEPRNSFSGGRFHNG